MRYHPGMSLPDDAPRGLALREAKAALRAQILAVRDAMSGAQRGSADAAISARVLALASWQQATHVLLTAAFRSEYDPRALVDAALSAGKVVGLPRVDTRTRMLVLHRVQDPERDVSPGYRTIPEPLPHTPVLDPAHIDWVLVPGVAFDLHGRRLGYGGGFYDRLLPSLRPGSARVAAIYAMQLVASVPAAPHDTTVDLIVTEHASVTTPGSRA